MEKETMKQIIEQIKDGKTNKEIIEKFGVKQGFLSSLKKDLKKMDIVNKETGETFKVPNVRFNRKKLMEQSLLEMGFEIKTDKTGTDEPKKKESKPKKK